MKQLDPKAVWLFFISFALRWLIVIIFLGAWFSGFFSAFRFRGTLTPSEVLFTFFGSSWLIIFALFILFLWIWVKLTYRFYRYELTKDSFRKEHGVIWKKYVSIPYDRIQNVDIYRGLIARLLGLSDLQIQTAGDTTRGSYGAFSEGRLPGLSRETAEQLRDELIKRAKQSKNQGL